MMMMMMMISESKASIANGRINTFVAGLHSIRAKGVNCYTKRKTWKMSTTIYFPSKIL
jgi:hypothetical protein